MQFGNNEGGFFQPDGGNNFNSNFGNNNAGGSSNAYGGEQQRRKPRIFTPLTIKMIAEAGLGPNEVVEIDGEQITDVSNL